MKNYSILFCFLMTHVIFAQQKFEREFRLQQNDVPKNASKFVNGIDFKKKIKWYGEESNDGKTFEAKVKYKKHLYSIEFNEKGVLLDVEKKIRFSKLANALQTKIQKEFSKRFQKHTIKKVQVQFKGLEGEVQKIFDATDVSSLSLDIFYEIVVKAKKEDTYSLYEFTFTQKGSFLKALKFTPESFINLEF